MKEQTFHKLSDVSDKSNHSDDNQTSNRSPTKQNQNVTSSFVSGLSK